MTNEPQLKTTDSETPKSSKKQWWIAGYIVAGIIWTLAQNNGFDKTPYDGLIILVVAILCGVYYHRLKAKIPSKTELVRIVAAFLIIDIVAAILIGFFTALF